MGDGHVASAASVVTWRDVCIARATQRPFPIAVGVISARCEGGATPKLAFFMRREPQEHPFWGGSRSAILGNFCVFARWILMEKVTTNATTKRRSQATLTHASTVECFVRACGSVHRNCSLAGDPGLSLMFSNFAFAVTCSLRA